MCAPSPSGFGPELHFQKRNPSLVPESEDSEQQINGGISGPRFPLAKM